MYAPGVNIESVFHHEENSTEQEYVSSLGGNPVFGNNDYDTYTPLSYPNIYLPIVYSNATGANDEPSIQSGPMVEEVD